MARKCVPLRDEKRRVLVDRFAEKRAELKKIIANPETSFEAQREAMFELQKLPKDSSKVRLVNRCSITGRPHGVFRAVGICRNKFRQMAANGELPGFTKSSW